LAFSAIASDVVLFFQLRATQDTAVRQLRPYLYVVPTDSQVTLFEDGSASVTVQPHIKVFGQTIAGDVDPQWELKIGPYPLDGSFVFNYLAPNSRSNAVAAPGESLPITAKTIVLTKEEVASITAGKKRIYADGTVLYVDSFGKGRWSNFCFNTDIKNIAKEHGSFATCPIHNSADWNPVDAQSPVRMWVPMK
jgi:hypothetical protein